MDTLLRPFSRLILSMCVLIGSWSLATAQSSLVHNRLRQIALGKADQVRKELPELLAEFPDDPGILLLHGMLVEDPNKAENIYERIVKNHPNSEWADDAQWRIVQYYALKRDSLRAHKELLLYRKMYPSSEFLLSASDIVRLTVGATAPSTLLESNAAPTVAGGVSTPQVAKPQAATAPTTPASNTPSQKNPQTTPIVSPNSTKSHDAKVVLPSDARGLPPVPPQKTQTKQPDPVAPTNSQLKAPTVPQQKPSVHANPNILSTQQPTKVPATVPVVKTPEKVTPSVGKLPVAPPPTPSKTQQKSSEALSPINKRSGSTETSKSVQPSKLPSVPQKTPQTSKKNEDSEVITTTSSTLIVESRPNEPMTEQNYTVKESKVRSATSPKTSDTHSPISSETGTESGKIVTKKTSVEGEIHTPSANPMLRTESSKPTGVKSEKTAEKSSAVIERPIDDGAIDDTKMRPNSQPSAEIPIVNGEDGNQPSVAKQFGLQIGLYDTYELAASKVEYYRRVKKLMTSIIAKKSIGGVRFGVVVGHYQNRESAEKKRDYVQSQCECTTYIVEK